MWRAASMIVVLQFLALAAPVHGSVAEGWGAPPHHAEAPKPDIDHAIAPEAAAEKVGLTASGLGALNQKSLVRKEGSAARAHHHHAHHAHSIRASFDALDLDKDGLITPAEIKEAIHKKHSNSETLTEMANAIFDGDHKGTSFAEFENAVHEAANLGVLKDHHSVAIHEHGQTTNSKVSCGGHQADTCAKCTTTMPDGSTSAIDHGSEWCNGECVYQQAACHLKGSEPDQSAGADTSGATGEHATTPTPDALNATQTEEDKEIIEKAAQAAVKEEAQEAAENQEKEKEDEENKGFSWSKFWLVVIIIVSVILFICCVATLVAVFVFGFNVRPASKEDAEDAALAEAEGESDGEEATEVAS